MYNHICSCIYDYAGGISMKKTVELPDSELDIMMILWDAGKPMMVSDVHEALQVKRPCTKPAVHSLIDRLAKKAS